MQKSGVSSYDDLGKNSLVGRQNYLLATPRIKPCIVHKISRILTGLYTNASLLSSTNTTVVPLTSGNTFVIPEIINSYTIIIIPLILL